MPSPHDPSNFDITRPTGADADGLTATSETNLLEQLRLQASHVEALQRKVNLLEQATTDCQLSKQEFVTELEHYKKLQVEGEWFFTNSLDMLCVLESNGQIRRANNAFWRLLGYQPDELRSQSIKHIIHPDDLERGTEELHHLRDGIDSINHQTRIRNKNGNWRWISWTCPALASAESGLYMIGRDITDNKLNEAELLYNAQHDALTTLANRARFDQGLAQAMARLGRNATNQVALLLIDLDGFKAVNDLYGHAAGDDVLKTVAARLIGCQRESDLVCRLGGDEFAWIIEGPAPLSIDPLAERIIDAVGAAIDFSGTQLHVGCSIGIAISTGNRSTAQELYQHADSAMYAVKKAGKNSYGYHAS